MHLAVWLVRLATVVEQRYMLWRLKVTYPDLPVSRRREEILDAMRESQVVVVVGETGSGKTTPLEVSTRKVTKVGVSTFRRVRVSSRFSGEDKCQTADVGVGA